MKQLGKPRRNLCAYLPLRKSDERRFSQAGGRISQCLAAERRISKDVRRVGQLQASMFLSNDEMHYKSVFRRFLVFVIFCGTIMGRLNE